MTRRHLRDLAESIRTQGVLAPLLVPEVAEERFEIVAGSGRYRAAQIAGATSVPVRVSQLNDAGSHHRPGGREPAAGKCEISLLDAAHNSFSGDGASRLEAVEKRYRVNVGKIAESVAAEFVAERKNRLDRHEAKGNGHRTASQPVAAKTNRALLTFCPPRPWWASLAILPCTKQINGGQESIGHRRGTGPTLNPRMIHIANRIAVSK
jgi:hypothetical protein